MGFMKDQKGPCTANKDILIGIPVLQYNKSGP